METHETSDHEFDLNDVLAVWIVASQFHIYHLFIDCEGVTIATGPIYPPDHLLDGREVCPACRTRWEKRRSELAERFRAPSTSMLDAAEEERAARRRAHEAAEEKRIRGHVEDWLSKAPDDGLQLFVPVRPFIDGATDLSLLTAESSPPKAGGNLRKFELIAWGSPDGPRWAAREITDLPTELPYRFGPPVRYEQTVTKKRAGS